MGVLLQEEGAGRWLGHRESRGQLSGGCPSDSCHQATNQLARSPSSASCSLPNGGAGRAEAGAALPGASYRRAVGDGGWVVTSIIAGLLS